MPPRRMTTKKGAKPGSDDSKSVKSKDPKRPENSVLGNDDISAGRLLRPADQLTLTETELKVEHERILNAKNPYAPDNIVRFNFSTNEFQKDIHVDHFATHFQLKGNLIHKESDEAQEQAALGNIVQEGTSTDEMTKVTYEKADGTKAEVTIAGKAVRNQFNYGERSAQTLNQKQRDIAIQTQPPPRENLSITVNQFVIYDAYKKELKKREAVDAKKTAPVGDTESARKDYLVECDAQIRIMERIVNQNIYADIAADFKFFEDQSDEFREGGEGTLLPLWRFSYQKAKKLAVTGMQWSPKYDDLFACTFGSYDFARQSYGLLVLYSLKNPSFPAYSYEIDVGMMCLDQHAIFSNMIAVGLYDGSIAVFNLLSKSSEPLFRCTTEVKHTDPVWSIKWQYEETDGPFEISLISISSDGLVKRWRVVKSELEAETILTLEDEGLRKTGEDGDTTASALGPVKACGTCIEFHPKYKTLFLVGSEEGKIYKCSTAYSSQYLFTYNAHRMGINAIKWNPYHPEIFLSCSEDWTCKIWTQASVAPLFSFDLQASVGDVAWSQMSSTSFVAATAEGKVVVYELNVDKYAPLCEQIIVQKKRTKLTHLAFNAEHPVVVAGDSKGHCTVLKLSPNLRKRPPRSKKDPRPMPVDQQQEHDKLQNLVNIVHRAASTEA